MIILELRDELIAFAHPKTAWLHLVSFVNDQISIKTPNHVVCVLLMTIDAGQLCSSILRLLKLMSY